MKTTLSGRVVMDASAVIAMLADVGPAGEWSTAQATDAYLAAPDLMPYEAANILRRHVLAGVLDVSAAYVALAELLGVPLVTLDARLARVPGLKRPVVAYEPA